mgnify:FL=1
MQTMQVQIHDGVGHVDYFSDGMNLIKTILGRADEQLSINHSEV